MIEKPQQGEAHCWAVVAVKALNEAKSRLTPVLSGTQRRDLATALLKRTLGLLQNLANRQQIAGFVVISLDEQVLQLTRQYQGQALLENKPATLTTAHEPLNLALTGATRYCYQELQAKALLILPSDLPWLTESDLEAMLNLARPYLAQPLSIIAPDQIEKGTNALFLQPADLLEFKYCFGEQSFSRHLTALQQYKQLEILIQRRPGLAFDLDRPEDWQRLSASEQAVLLQS